MYKPVIAGAVISLGFLGFAQEPDAPGILFKEERMTVHYTPAVSEATIVVKAESEVPIQDVAVIGPAGRGLLRMRSQEGAGIALQGFSVESCEMKASELFATYPEGSYDMRGLAKGRRPVSGGAVLSHRMLPEPQVTYPIQDSVNVPTNNLTVTWNPQPGASGYRVAVEQNDADGLVIELPPTSNSLLIPDGFLRSKTPTQVEVGVIAGNGNTTLKEIYFTTL